MKLKTVEIEGKQYAEINADGRVLYDNNGQEFAFDAADTYAKIQQLTGEAKSHREAKQTLEAQLAELSGKLEGVDLSKMVDAGKLEEVRAEVAKSYQSKLDEIQGQYDGLQTKYNEEKIASAFAGSKYLADKLNLPAEVAKATFANNVKIDNGKLIMQDAEGNPIYSRQKPGEYAGFDEGLSIIVESLPYRDSILKPSNHNGSGGDNQGGQSRTVTRAEFESMSVSEQSSTASGIRAGTVALVD